MNTGQGRYLLAITTVSLAAMLCPLQVSAGGLDLGGIVGGTVHGTLGALGGSSGGSTGGISAKAGVSIGQPGATVKANTYIGSIKAKTKIVLLKKRKLVDAKVLIGKHGSYGKHHNIAKVTAVVGTKPLNAKATVLVGSYGSYHKQKLTKVTVGIGPKPLDAKAKVFIGNAAKAKVYASLGHKTKLKGRVVLAGVSASVGLGLNLGGNGGNNPGGGTPPGGSPGGSSPGAMASTFRDLSMHDQFVMAKKCSAVLAAPSRYDTDMVELCRIIATL